MNVAFQLLDLLLLLGDDRLDEITDRHHADYAPAVEHADKAAPLLWAARGQICTAEYHLFAALARGALARRQPGADRGGVQRQLEEHERELAGWANARPQSFQFTLAKR